MCCEMCSLIVGLNSRVVRIMLFKCNNAFVKRVCSLAYVRKFSANDLGDGLSWTYFHPYQAVKIDLCNSACLSRWTGEGADTEFEQCLRCKIKFGIPFRRVCYLSIH